MTRYAIIDVPPNRALPQPNQTQTNTQMTEPKDIEPTVDNRLLAAARYLHHSKNEEKERATLRTFNLTAQQNKTPTGRIKKHWQVEIDKQSNAVSDATRKASICLKVFAQVNWEMRKADKAQSISNRDKVLERLTNAITQGEILSVPSARIDISKEYEWFLKEHIRLMSIDNPDYAKDRDFRHYGDLGDDGQVVVYDLTHIVQERHAQSLRDNADPCLYEEEVVWDEEGGKSRRNGKPIKFHLSMWFNATGDFVRAELHHGSVTDKPVDRKRLRSEKPYWSFTPMTDAFGNSFLDHLNFAATGTKSDNEMRAEAYAMLLVCDLAKVLTPFKQDRNFCWDDAKRLDAEALYHSNRCDADALLEKHGTDIKEYLKEEDVDAVATAE